METQQQAIQFGHRCRILSNADYRGCSNRGISEFYLDVTVVGDDVTAALANGSRVRDDSPTVRIVRRNIAGQPYVHAEPVNKPEGQVGPMAGGAYIVGNGEAWRKLVGHPYPIPLHDRFETVELYNLMSN